MQFYMTRTIGLCFGIVFGIAASASAVDLAQRYPATLDFSEQSEGYEWSSGPQDVWRLKEFQYASGNSFRVTLGPSQVVFGCHGSNVVWASVFPDQPGQIVAGTPGKGEHVTSVWLRFHPGRLGELFPERIVAGQGDASTLPHARRLAAHKMGACWHSGDRVLIPSKNSITFDLETREGPRRFYSLDTDTGKAEYEDFFRTRSLAVPKPLVSETAAEVFDEVWKAFDREYAMFLIKPRADWAKLRQTYRPRAAAARTNQDLATVISEMLDHLEDLHVYVQVDGQYVPGYNRNRPLNANPKALARLIGKITETRHDLDWGRTDDGLGYINIYKLSDIRLPEILDEVLGQMADTKGLILDLRYNGGGDEGLGCQIAGRLLDRRRVYSLSQFRNGPKHADLGEKNERACGPAGPWHYVGPVVVLQGQKTMSSAESFALALAQCPQATTLGDRTAGSSGNPRRLVAGAGIVVNLPQWLDMDPAGKPIDAVGVLPRVKIEAKPEDFRGENDPVLAAALAHLRGRLKAEGPRLGGVLERRPGVPLRADRPRVTSVFPAPGAVGVNPLTEIRIRFDRPMDPNYMYLQADPDNAGNFLRFRLRTSPKYLSETNEFVIPVLMRAGSQYQFSLPLDADLPDTNCFWSRDGVPAAPYSWRFTTRAAVAAAGGPASRVLSVDPPSGAQTGMVASIRVLFDRPMDPEACEPTGSARRLKDGSVPLLSKGVSVPFPIEYDAASHSFTFVALLCGSAKARIELQGLRGADGVQPAPATVEYQVGATLFRAEQEARIAEAGRSAKLREVVEAVRRKRLAIESLEETVRSMLQPSDDHRPNWGCTLYMYAGRFGFQGDRRFYVDETGIARSPYFTSSRVGSDGRECWKFQAGRDPESARERKHVLFCPYEAVDEKKVVICDPFGAKRFPSTKQAIEALRLEYLGEVKREGRNCHRIRSWAGSLHRDDFAAGFWDCIIDAQSLLPVVCDAYASGCTWRYEFLYERVNEPIAQEKFQAPSGADVTREPFKIKAGNVHLDWGVKDCRTCNMGGYGGPGGKNGDGKR